MLQKIVNFIKYHNAFAIGFTLLFSLMSVSFAASPDLRSSVYSSKSMVSAIDNHRIVLADLDNFNFNLKINSVTEDDKKYYIDYTYKTIAIEDGVWMDKLMKNTLIVSKESLGEKDLGLYVAKELGDNINYELSYLKRVQDLEKGKGVSNKIVTTEYAGLVGKLLDPKEKVIEGYQPIIPEPEPEVVPTPEKPVAPDPSLFVENLPNYQKPDINSSGSSNSKVVLDESSIRLMVENMLTEYQKQKDSTVESNSDGGGGETPPPSDSTLSTDTTPPIITLNGSATVTLNVGEAYVEEGVSATDNLDVLVAVITNGEVDVATAGTYIITYTATDSAGNIAVPVVRTVNVGDIIEPTPEPEPEPTPTPEPEPESNPPPAENPTP